MNLLVEQYDNSRMLNDTWDTLGIWVRPNDDNMEVQNVKDVKTSYWVFSNNFAAWRWSALRNLFELLLQVQKHHIDCVITKSKYLEW